MKIQEIIELYKLEPLYLEKYDKEYLFTCTLNNARILTDSFIYIPFFETEDRAFDLIEQASCNEYCKGFMLNKSCLKDEKQIKKFHLLMKKYSQNYEVILLTKNIYNVGYGLALQKCAENDMETVVVIDTEEGSATKEMLVESLSKAGKNVTFSSQNCGKWQKICEPLLLSDSSTRFAIIELAVNKIDLFSKIVHLKNKHILLPEFNPININLHLDLQNFLNSLSEIFDDNTIRSIFTFEDNDLVNDIIPYYAQDKIHFVKEKSQKIHFQQDFYYLNRSYAMVHTFLKYFGLSPIKSTEFIEKNPLYLSENMSFKVNKINFQSITESLKIFFCKFKHDKSCIILGNIVTYGDHKEAVYMDLFSYIAQFNPDILVLLNLKNFSYLYKRFNHHTYVKNFSYTDINDKINLDRFLKNLKNQDYAFFIAFQQGGIDEIQY